MSSSGRSSADVRRCDFFISRAGESRKWALWVARQLQIERYSVLYQERDFDNGDNVVVEIGNATANSERTLLILSGAYFSSGFTEVEYTVRIPDKKLLLFRVADVTLRPELTPFKFSDLFDLDEETARKILIEEVRQAYGPSKHPYDGDIPAADFPGARIQITPASPAIATSAVVHLSATPLPVQPPVAKVPADVLENIAYLCDRLPQENHLGSILTSECCPRTVICIAHGDEIERVDRFAQRLHTYSVPKYVKDDRPIRPIAIEWPKVTAKTSISAFQTDLRMSATRQMLSQKLQDATAVVRTNLLVSRDCARREKELVQAYVDFWQKVDVPVTSRLLVCLMVRYPAERGMSIFKRLMNSHSASDAMRDLLRDDTPGVVNCHVLPVLAPVERGEVDGWIELAEVQQYRLLTAEDILRVYDDDRVTAIPMGELAPKLVELLKPRKETQR
ncbi:MAG TPA: TIR domain-containing protein [Thermoanaerobaculia bacterium]